MMQYLIPAGFVMAMALTATAYADTPLYTRLGGETVVTQIVNQTVDTVAQDLRVNQSFD